MSICDIILLFLGIFSLLFSRSRRSHFEFSWVGLGFGFPEMDGVGFVDAGESGLLGGHLGRRVLCRCLNWGGLVNIYFLVMCLFSLSCHILSSTPSSFLKPPLSSTHFLPFLVVFSSGLDGWGDGWTYKLHLCLKMRSKSRGSK